MLFGTCKCYLVSTLTSSSLTGFIQYSSPTAFLLNLSPVFTLRISVHLSSGL